MGVGEGLNHKDQRVRLDHTRGSCERPPWFYFLSFLLLHIQDSIYQKPCPTANLPNSRCNSQGLKKAATNTQVVSITSIKFDYIHQVCSLSLEGDMLI